MLLAYHLVLMCTRSHLGQERHHQLNHTVTQCTIQHTKYNHTNMRLDHTPVSTEFELFSTQLTSFSTI